MKILRFLLTLSVSFIIVGEAYSQHEHHHHHDHEEHNHHDHHHHHHSGLMGEHAHFKGEWMISFTSTNTYGQRNLSGTNSVPISQIFDQGYVMASRSMFMQMNMLEVMYAVTDRLMLMGMVDFMIHLMDHGHAPGFGENHSHNTVGFSDTVLGTYYRLFDSSAHLTHLELGFTIPTGRFDFLEGYNMQLGSGTVDLVAGINHALRTDNFIYGFNAGGRFHFYENSRNYRRGNEYSASIYSRYLLTDTISPILRFEYNLWENITGRDPLLDPEVDPARNPLFQGGQRVDIGVGLLLSLNSNRFQSLNLIFETMLPVYQNLDGPQLSQDFMGNIGLQLGF